MFKKIIKKIFKSDEKEGTGKIYKGKYNNFNKTNNIQNEATLKNKNNILKEDTSQKQFAEIIQDNIEVTVTNNGITNPSLDDLEKEYEKNIQEIGIRNTLKYNIVLYLNQIKEHPLKKDLWSSNHLDETCTKEQIEEHVLNKGYIKQAEGDENLKNIIPSYTVAELKEVLKKYNLKVSGRKQELIDRLKENLTQEELCAEFNKHSYIVTEEGLKLINENPQVTLYQKYFLHHNLREYEMYYQENKTDNMEEFSINYLIKEGEKNIEKCDWFCYYWQSLREIAYLYFDYKKFALSLNYFMQLFICELSFWKDNYYSIEYGTPLSEQYIEKLLETVEIVKLDLNELKNQFYDCYNKSKVPLLIIPKEDMFKYFLEVINGTHIEKINREIDSRITVPENLKFEVHFNNSSEMNEVVEKIKLYEIYK